MSAYSKKNNTYNLTKTSAVRMVVRILSERNGMDDFRRILKSEGLEVIDGGERWLKIKGGDKQGAPIMEAFERYFAKNEIKL